MSSNHVRQMVLEVERKFSRFLVDPLTIDGGRPPFRALSYLGSRSFRDIYYDYQDSLAGRGTWVRQRDGIWQAKARRAGDFDRSQFQEIQDVKEIQHHIHTITKRSVPSSKNFGLSVTAEITTHRETWKADDRFTVVLDRTDFGHVVGEVELESTVVMQSDAEVQSHCTKMDLEIAEFMQRYNWAFDTSPVMGKLTAYFKWRKEQQ